MNSSIVRLSVCLCVILITACENLEQDGQRLAKTYARVLIEREAGLDSATAAKHIDSIIKASGYTAQDFERRLREHGTTPKDLRSFYDSVSTELERMRSDSTR